MPRIPRLIFFGGDMPPPGALKKEEVCLFKSALPATFARNQTKEDVFENQLYLLSMPETEQ